MSADNRPLDARQSPRSRRIWLLVPLLLVLVVISIAQRSAPAVAQTGDATATAALENVSAAAAVAATQGFIEGLRVAGSTAQPVIETLSAALTAAASSQQDAVATALNEGFIVGGGQTPLPTRTPRVTRTPTPTATVLMGRAQAIATAREEGYREALSTALPIVGTLQADSATLQASVLAGDNIGTIEAAVDASIRSEALIRAQTTLIPAFNATVTALYDAAQATIDALEVELVEARSAVTAIAAAPTTTPTNTPTLTPTVTPIPLDMVTSTPTMTPVALVTATLEPSATPGLSPAQIAIQETATQLGLELTGTPGLAVPTATPSPAEVEDSDAPTVPAASVVPTVPAVAAPLDALPDLVTPLAPVEVGELIYARVFGFGYENDWFTGARVGLGTASLQATRYALTAFAGRSLAVTNEMVASDVYAEVHLDTSACPAAGLAGLMVRVDALDAAAPQDGIVFAVSCDLAVWQALRLAGDSDYVNIGGAIIRSEAVAAAEIGSHPTLGLQADGDTLTLYLNGVQLATVTADAASAEGQIGLFVAAPASSDATARFSGFTIWALP